MARRVFFSFDYDGDKFRASQVRSMGILEGERVAHDNDWESVKKGTDEAIRKWILGQMDGTSCTVVLVGEHTASSRWVQFEIVEAWNQRKGLLGVYINRLKCMATQSQSVAGSNPLDLVNVGGVPMSKIVKTYVPPYSDSKLVYDYIKTGLPSWIEEGIAIRGRYS